MEKIIQDCRQLIAASAEGLGSEGHKIQSCYTGEIKWQKKSISELFLEVLDIPILEYLDKNKLRNLIADKYPRHSPAPKTSRLIGGIIIFCFFLTKLNLR